MHLLLTGNGTVPISIGIGVAGVCALPSALSTYDNRIVNLARGMAYVGGLTDGRVHVIPPQSGVLAYNFNLGRIYAVNTAGVML